MSGMGASEHQYDSYAEFYACTYGQHIVSNVELSSIGATAIEAHQSAGDWSDAATPDLIVAWLSSRSVGFDIDLGSGRFSGRQMTNDAVLIAPGVGTTILMHGSHACRMLTLPYKRLYALAGAEASPLPSDGDFGSLHAGLLRDYHLTSILDALWTEANERCSRDLLLADGLLLQLSSRLLRMRTSRTDGSNKARGGLAPWQERRATEYLSDHLDENVTLSDLAATANLSAFHFARQFKESTGLPPHAYQRHLRCDRAKALLADTDLPVTEIAAQVGYETPQAFARMFRAEVGASPTEYRRARTS